MYILLLISFDFKNDNNFKIKVRTVTAKKEETINDKRQTPNAAEARGKFLS